MAVSIGPKIGIDGEAEYRKQLNNIITQTKTLDKEMKNLDSTFDEAKEGMSKHEKELELAKDKAEKLSDVVDQMREMVEKSTEATGENSDQTEKWKQKLSDAEAALQKANDAVEDLSSPLGELTDSISDQESELQSLKDEYANAWLAGDTERCEDLAQAIRDTSSALSDNQSALEEAKASADGFDQTLDVVREGEESVGGASSAMSSAFGGSMTSMANAIATADIYQLISDVVSVVNELADSAIDVQNEFDDAEAVLARATGAMGEELDELAQKGKDAWLAIADKNGTIADSDAVLGTLTTRFGDLGESAKETTQMFLEFNKETGQNGVAAVNDIADAMWTFGSMTNDVSTNVTTMNSYLDMFTKASELADLSMDDLAGVLTGKVGNAFADVGYSVEDVVSLLVNYRNVGGETSTITSGMQTAIKKLADETKDVPGAFNDIITTLQSGGSEFDILNHKVEGTDKTIQDVFGKTNASTIVNTFSRMTSAGADFTGEIQNADGALSDLYKENVHTADGISYYANKLESATGISADYWEQMFKMTGQYSLLAAAGTAAGKAEADALDESLDAIEDNVEATDDLVTATTDYSEAVEDTSEVMEDVTEDIEELTEEQQKALDNIQSHIDTFTATLNKPLGSTWFDELEEKETVSAETLSANLQKQIDSMSNWEVNMNKLADAGINQGLLQYLAEMGPEGAAYVQGLCDDIENNNGAMLDTINAQWEEKYKISNLADEEGQKLLANVGVAAAAVEESMSGIAVDTAEAAKKAAENTSEIADTTSSNLDETARSAEEGASSARVSVESNFASLPNYVYLKMQRVVDHVKEGISQIKSALAVTLQGPNIQVPHFRMSGAFDAKTNAVPTVQVDWYAKAMQNAYLFNSPSLIGVGEAGAEVVVGEAHLLNMVTEAVGNALRGGTTNNYAGSTINVYATEGQNVQQLADLVSKQIDRNMRIRR